MNIEGKRKYRRGARHIDCGRLDSKLRRNNRHELMQLASDTEVDKFDSLFGELFDSGEAARQFIEFGEIIVMEGGVLFWTANGSCCFSDKFEFSDDELLQSTAA